MCVMSRGRWLNVRSWTALQEVRRESNIRGTEGDVGRGLPGIGVERFASSCVLLRMMGLGID